MAAVPHHSSTPQTPPRTHTAPRNPTPRGPGTVTPEGGGVGAVGTGQRLLLLLLLYRAAPPSLVSTQAGRQAGRWVRRGNRRRSAWMHGCRCRGAALCAHGMCLPAYVNCSVQRAEGRTSRSSKHPSVSREHGCQPKAHSFDSLSIMYSTMPAGKLCIHWGSRGSRTAASRRRLSRRGAGKQRQLRRPFPWQPGEPHRSVAFPDSAHKLPQPRRRVCGRRGDSSRLSALLSSCAASKDMVYRGSVEAKKADAEEWAGKSATGAAAQHPIAWRAGSRELRPARPPPTGTSSSLN